MGIRSRSEGMAGRLPGRFRTGEGEGGCHIAIGATFVGCLLVKIKDGCACALQKVFDAFCAPGPTHECRSRFNFSSQYIIRCLLACIAELPTSAVHEACNTE